MTDQLHGILPVLPTAFRMDGGVDLAAAGRLADFAVGCGVGGVVFPGFASEVSELSDEERSRLLAAVVERLPEGMPSVAGATAGGADEVVKHGKVARGFGIGFLMIQPPVSLGRELEPVYGFFAQVAEALPEMRIVLQNAPAPRGSDLAPETILDLARRLPQITYVKEETLPAGPAISRILLDRPDTLRGVIGGGGARYILDEYARGACAAMPAVEIADLHVALDRAWRAGDRAKAREIYVRTLPLLALQAVYRMRLTKHVMMRRGILENTLVRALTPELDAPAIADIDANLVELGFWTDPSPPEARGG